MATRKTTTQPAAPAKVQTPPNNIDNIAAPDLDTKLADTEREYASAVASVGRLGDELRVLRAELAASRS